MLHILFRECANVLHSNHSLPYFRKQERKEKRFFSLSKTTYTTTLRTMEYVSFEEKVFTVLLLQGPMLPVEKAVVRKVSTRNGWILKLIMVELEQQQVVQKKMLLIPRPPLSTRTRKVDF